MKDMTISIKDTIRRWNKKRRLNHRNRKAKPYESLKESLKTIQDIIEILRESPKEWLGNPSLLTPKKTQSSKTTPVDSVLLEVIVQAIGIPLPAISQTMINYLAQMSAALLNLNLKVELSDSIRYSDAAPRLPADNQICISFHSHGNEDRVWRVKESYLPDYFTFDRLGYSGYSELAQYPKKFTDDISQFSHQQAEKIIAECKATLFDKNLSKYDQPDTLEHPLPDDYIFYPLQTVVDVVAVFARVSQHDALWQLAELSETHKIALVIKRHPFCDDDKTEQTLHAIIKKYPNTHLINASIHTLIQNARAVVGANSGAMFEAALQGKLVYSFASSDFELATIALQNTADFAKVFAHPQKQSEDVVRFLGWYLGAYCFNINDPEQINNKINYALKDASLSLPSNQATRTYIKAVFSTLEKARLDAINKM